MIEDQLSEHEKRLFRSLENKMEPPTFLENRIVDQLIEQGHIKKSNTIINKYIKPIIGVAASVILFVAGMYFQKTLIEEPFQIDLNNGYMLILHEDQNFNHGDPMEMFQEYSNWMGNTIERGVKITGHELKNEAAIVRSDERIAMLDGSEGQRTTGYFIIEASSMEEALEVARNNPHIKYGGTIEVKPFIVR